MPESVDMGDGAFELTTGVTISVEPATEEMKRLGRLLADRLGAAMGHAVPVRPGTGARSGSIHLTTAAGDPALGEEGYALTIAQDRVVLVAHRPAGAFYGLQTIRQLLPPAIEGPAAQVAPLRIAAATIRDRPRFAWRGAMLDVARHFFDVGEVERLVEEISLYKMNRLHLHLSDDQGWRIAVDAWPRLAPIGGSTEVGGGDGARYYSQSDYAEIVSFARNRYVTVVPEIDMPGHTNAALASHPELNCDGVARSPYTGVEVGFSSLCLTRGTTPTFVRDVVREIAALTPGPYFHVGGDEASATDPAAYVRFVDEAQSIVNAYGKRMIGWEEVAAAHLLPTSIVQQWDRGLVQEAVRQGATVILSPSKRAYLDMMYDRATPLGQNWAGYITVKDAYDWDPATYLADVPEAVIVGVEAPLWTETLRTRSDVDYMAFPRLAGIGEVGWSPRAGRRWEDYRARLGVHGPRFEAMGVGFFRSPQVPWM
jgi:hexosaminidase